MKVLMLGFYGEKHPRTKILYKGLESNGVKVKRLCVKGFFGYFKILRTVLKEDYDIIIPTGKPALFTVWLFRFIHKKKIVFDEFISDYDTLVCDRKLVKRRSLMALILRIFDKMSCLVSDFIFLDTKEHVDYFLNEFGLRKIKDKFFVVPIGADEDIFFPVKSEKRGTFKVCFHGTFIPLQGIEYILKAAKILDSENVNFWIIGEGQTKKSMFELSRKLKLKNVKFFGFKSPKEVRKLASEADVCLGIFGKTNKAKRVIPNKAYEIIAMEKPLISGDSKPMRRIFQNGFNCLLCDMANGKSLAKSIRILIQNKKLRSRMAKNGYLLYLKKFTTKKIGFVLKKRLQKIIS